MDKPAPHALVVRAFQSMLIYGTHSDTTMDAIQGTFERVWRWANKHYPMATINPDHYPECQKRIESYWHTAVKTYNIDMWRETMRDTDGVDLDALAIEIGRRPAMDVTAYWHNVMDVADTLDAAHPAAHVSHRALVHQLQSGRYYENPAVYQPGVESSYLSMFDPERLDLIVQRATPVLEAYGLELEGGTVRAGWNEQRVTDSAVLSSPTNASSKAAKQLWHHLTLACQEHPFLIYAVLASTGTMGLGMGWARLCATILAWDHELPTTNKATAAWTNALRRVARAVADAYETPAKIWDASGEAPAESRHAVADHGGVRYRLRPADL